MNVSVVILHYGHLHYTLKALDGVPAGTEVVLVDNDGGLRMLRCDATVIRPARNRGFAAGCNLGARAATGDVVVFLNNDAFGENGWFDALTLPFALDADVAVTGARLTYPDGTLQHAGVAVDFSRPAGSEAWNVVGEQPGGDADAVTGAAMAVRRSMFDQLGGFDEGYWNGYEDVDLCLNVRAHGGRVIYCPKARLTHLESASGPERWRAVNANVARLRGKWS